jgi:hypothetical protein
MYRVRFMIFSYVNFTDVTVEIIQVFSVRFMIVLYVIFTVVTVEFVQFV